MSSPSKTDMLIAGLRVRGYSEAKPRDGRRCFAISPSHARRLTGRAQDWCNRLWVTDGLAVRHGVSWEMGKAIRRVTIRAVMAEGLDALRAAAKQEAKRGREREVVVIGPEDLDL